MKNLVPAILILAVIGLFFGFIDPKREEIKALREDRTEYEEALENSRKLRAERDRLVSIEQSITQENRNKLMRFLPDNIDNIRLVIDIDNIARRYGLSVRDFNTSTDQSDQIIDQGLGNHGTVIFSFSTSGSYNAFIAFLKDMERSLRLIDAAEIAFSVPEDEGANVYDYDVTIKTYWLR